MCGWALEKNAWPISPNVAALRPDLMARVMGGENTWRTTCAVITINLTLREDLAICRLT